MSAPIFPRAPLHVRYSREYLFEPKFVSIGPLYYEKLKEQTTIQKAKEECISYFASKLQTSTSNPNINDPIQQFNDLAAQQMNVQSREWYSNNFGLNEDEFFTMLVRDCCFIIRILLAFSREGEEFLLYPEVDINIIRFDLLLVENQIPFFFLERVYYFLRANTTIFPQVPASELSPISNFNSPTSPQGQTQTNTQLPDPEQGRISQTTNLVEFLKKIPFFFLERVYYFLRANTTIFPPVPASELSPISNSNSPTSPQGQTQTNTQLPDPEQGHISQTTNLDEFLKELKPFIWLDMPWQFNEQATLTDPKHLLDLYWRWCLPSSIDDQGNNEQNNPPNDGAHVSWVKIHSRRNAPKRVKNAYELYLTAGVTFEKRAHNDGFGVTFENGILQIPHLQLHPNQISLLANLVAFEEFKPSTKRLLTSYILLVDGLIYTKKDVELLQRLDLITNKLSSTQMGLTCFNDIRNFCSVNDDHHCREQFDKLNSYYSRRWNRQYVKFQRRYSDNPWAAGSFLVGVSVFWLAFIQTVFTLSSFYCYK